MKEALEYFGGKNLPAKIWTDKYRAKLRNEKTPDDMHNRMADA